jgi:hypothetical protein
MESENSEMPVGIYIAECDVICQQSRISGLAGIFQTADIF